MPTESRSRSRSKSGSRSPSYRRHRKKHSKHKAKKSKLRSRSKYRSRSRSPTHFQFQSKSVSTSSTFEVKAKDLSDSSYASDNGSSFKKKSHIAKKSGQRSEINALGDKSESLEDTNYSKKVEKSDSAVSGDKYKLKELSHHSTIPTKEKYLQDKDVSKDDAEPLDWNFDFKKYKFSLAKIFFSDKYFSKITERYGKSILNVG